VNVYRLAKAPYADDLTGTGARLAGGRWNRRGVAVLYTSSSRALATLEVLVHIPAAFVPRDGLYRMVELYLPDDSLAELDKAQLPEGWNQLTPLPALQRLTDQWLTERKSLVLKVPSVVISDEHHFLVNPLHPRFGEVNILQQTEYVFDRRLL